MLPFEKMKKCEFCERSFGQEPFGRHSLHCGRGFSYLHRQHGQEDKYVIKSHDFMQRLEDAFLHAFVKEQTEDSNSVNNDAINESGTIFDTEDFQIARRKLSAKFTAEKKSSCFIIFFIFQASYD